MAKTTAKSKNACNNSNKCYYARTDPINEGVTFLDVQAIVIENDNWKAARLDYRLGNEEHVLPLFVTDGAWLHETNENFHHYPSSDKHTFAVILHDCSTVYFSSKS